MPFCVANNLRFLTGNGIFAFVRLDGSIAHQEISLWDEWCHPNDNTKASSDAPGGWQLVLDVCRAEVPMNNGYGLGSMMDSYGEGNDGTTNQ